MASICVILDRSENPQSFKYRGYLDHYDFIWVGDAPPSSGYSLIIIPRHSNQDIFNAHQYAHYVSALERKLGLNGSILIM